MTPKLFSQLWPHSPSHASALHGDSLIAMSRDSA